MTAKTHKTKTVGEVHGKLNGLTGLIDQPKSSTQRVLEVSSALVIIGAGVAAASYLKPRKEDWGNKDGDVKNAMLIGASVSAMIAGLTLSGIVAKKAIDPNNHYEPYEADEEANVHSNAG